MKLDKNILKKIFKYANNNCHTCKNYCKIPLKKQSKFYFFSEICYLYI